MPVTGFNRVNVRDVLCKYLAEYDDVIVNLRKHKMESVWGMLQLALNFELISSQHSCKYGPINAPDSDLIYKISLKTVWLLTNILLN